MALETTLKLTTPTSLCWCLTTLVELGITVANVIPTVCQNYLHNDHGPLAALYPQDYISEGDSPAFLYTLGSGLRGYEDPTYGGWGGQFYKIEGLKNVYRDVDRGSYLRWVEVANRDFESRLRWCVAGKYEDANHKPVIAIPGGLEKQ